MFGFYKNLKKPPKPPQKQKKPKNQVVAPYVER